MDFIAEIVLGYIDRILGVTLQRQGIVDYKILRYRDDYRIFVNNSNDGEMVLKLLSEIKCKQNKRESRYYYSINKKG